MSGKQPYSKTLPIKMMGSSPMKEQNTNKSATTTPAGSQGEAEGGSASGNDKKIAGKTGEEPGKTNQITGKPAKESDRQSPKPASGSGSSGITQPKKSFGTPEITKKSKRDHGQKTHDVGSARSEEELGDTETLLEKRTKELNEQEEECKDLSEKVQKKGEELDELDKTIKKLKTENGSLSAEVQKKKEENESLQHSLSTQEHKMMEINKENSQLQQKNRNLIEEKEKLVAEMKLMGEQFSKHVDKIYKDNKRKLDEVHEHYQREIRTRENMLSDVKKERDDLKTRFSKLAGAKLTDQNADIADLSDPNRAMKVSERFGTLYDDDWTDAFEELKKKKIPVKDAIQFLLSILQECLIFCNRLKDQQMDSLKNVLLHPSQDVSKFVNEPRKNVGGFKEKPRISSKDEKGVRDLRRQIGVSETCIEEVKQVFVMETKSWDKKGFDKKHLDLCMPYIQKCAEVCWLMVLHDPPLYMKMDAKYGDKMDLNLYTVYSSTGDTIDYLVWPPLYNEMGGGLISKGAAECVRSIKKK